MQATRRLGSYLVTGAVLAAIGLGTTACTPDTTRGRVEADVPQTFARSYALSEQLQGRPPVHPQVTSSECHSSVNPTEDSGPGSWNCDLSYTVGHHRTKKSLLVLIDQLGCYQAMDSEHRDATIVDRKTGARLPDPKVGFDGCYDVYDHQTSVSKH